MAEGTSQVKVAEELPEIKEKGADHLECAVCLQQCVHPAQLPCGHIFCFLCVKGIANQSKRCAMCRQEIPRDFIEQPKLLQRPETTESFDGGYQWFYEGRNGWWQYDPRTSEDIEQAFQLHLDTFEILICGETYAIDFQQKVQYPKQFPSRKRFIKRDLIGNINSVKGVAGWWQYDERTSRELEACYKAGERTCELLIAGFLYVADLDTMIQMRRNDHSRRRRIKRDLANVPKKGVAGLRTDVDQVQPAFTEYSSIEAQRPHSPTEGHTDGLIPVTPSNTPQTPVSGRESPHREDLEATMERIRSLRLDAADNSRLRALQSDNGQDRAEPSRTRSYIESSDAEENYTESNESFRGMHSRFQF